LGNVVPGSYSAEMKNHEVGSKPRFTGRSRLGRPSATVAAMLAVAVLVAAWATGTATAAAPAPVPSGRVAAAASPVVTFARLARGLNEPTSITHLGARTLLITERRGLVRAWSAAGLAGRPWLDIRGRVNSSGGEQGLLGLTLHPRFAVNGVAYVTYTRADGALVLAAVQTRAPGGFRVVPILAVPHPDADNHNGGSMTWNRRGQLVLGTGDGGGGGDGFDNARRPGSLLGKILLITVEARRPIVKVWLIGARNPWKMSTDAVTGEILIGDVGQGDFEEVDRVPFALARGDLGWPCREGRAVFDSSRCAGRVMTPPLAVFCHSDRPGCPTLLGAEALIGGYVYRGRAYAPLLAGQYLAGDWLTGNVWAVGRGGAIRTVGSLPGVTSFGQTATREIVAVTYDGSLWAMRARAGN